MWELIPIKKMPPTRLTRYCCTVLKETTGNGRMIATGVRWAESVARAKNRSQFEVLTAKRQNKILLSDNDDKRQLFEACTLKAKRVVNPIIDWTDDDIWEYAKSEKLCLNPLYDCGFKRVGCVGCPMASSKGRAKWFAAFPKYRDMYISAFARMLEVRKAEGYSTGTWQSPIDVYHWWMQDGVLPGQIEMGDILNESSYSLS